MIQLYFHVFLFGRKIRQTAFLLIVLLNPATGFGEEDSPTQVVQHWLRVYPSDMVRAADLTTKAFRRGRTKEEWIHEHGSLLRNLRLKNLQGTVLSQQVQEDQAQVVVRVRVSTLLGQQDQKELYVLRQDQQGRWLIDEVKEYEENYIGYPM